MYIYNLYNKQHPKFSVKGTLISTEPVSIKRTLTSAMLQKHSRHPKFRGKSTMESVRLAHFDIGFQLTELPGKSGDGTAR